MEFLNSRTRISLTDHYESIIKNYHKPRQLRGKPCIRNMKIRMIDILDLSYNDLSHKEIGKEMPDLEPDDLNVSLP
ncbi:DUF433 domain-containing protein [Leptospira ainlahdjerensis]|nr:DUF433 domain-containing protein [Leptospira ainlahdjerensis]